VIEHPLDLRAEFPVNGPIENAEFDQAIAYFGRIYRQEVVKFVPISLGGVWA
jgi:hypothetical protein